MKGTKSVLEAVALFSSAWAHNQEYLFVAGLLLGVAAGSALGEWWARIWLYTEVQKTLDTRHKAQGTRP